MTEKVQRLRLTFARDDGARYLTHLDVMRMWERVLKRADLPLAYSEGFTPRPRIALAAPLAVGMTSECDLLEIITVQRLPVPSLSQRLPPQLPAGFRLLDVREVPLGHPFAAVHGSCRLLRSQRSRRPLASGLVRRCRGPPRPRRDPLGAHARRRTAPLRPPAADPRHRSESRPTARPPACVSSSATTRRARGGPSRSPARSEPKSRPRASIAPTWSSTSRRSPAPPTAPPARRTSPRGIRHAPRHPRPPRAVPGQSGRPQSGSR